MTTRRYATGIKLAIQCIVLIVAFQAKAQDVQFSQFYNVPLYLNPAFAGSAHHDRAIVDQRLQWPGLAAKYMTSFASFDTYFSQYRSGVGGYIIRDFEGNNNVGSTNLALQYSYELYINNKLTLRPGLQFQGSQNYVNYSGLLFPSQIDTTYSSSVGASPYNYGKQSKFYGDVSSGAVLYSDQLWLSFTANHMNSPNQSVMPGIVSRLPVKISANGGYKILLNHKKTAFWENTKDISLTPTFSYKKQGASEQLDIGLYFMYDFLLTGAWYRGIPIIHYEKGIPNNESIVLLAGCKVGDFTFCYSYDYTISQLQTVRSGGSHELNITYIRKYHKRTKPMKRLPCPNFYSY